MPATHAHTDACAHHWGAVHALKVVLVCMCQFGAAAWAVPSKTEAAWASRGHVQTLLSHCMCQEGDVLMA
eukprot:4341505-Pleurochrysis_carterae.AAC.1